ncbi:TonB dependent receptor [Arenibacter nanhaiticus]|uniref:TonB dependent receptor n=1 Tax=Arenibacter nanhaiticus TaxID=558155 RepID=A0A1M6JVN0_9FLAO|nr:TonB-dependent receptor [Arenibacter nanhaiticus]SHJ50730.1 TonB dependent receptor [Arenibacter nanhaiticus]
MHKHIKITLFSIVGFLQVGLAQEDEKKGIGTETVTVVKAYAPTISDAFKIKSVPSLNDSLALQKKPITYSIFSLPVASTFTPSKGKATAVKRTPAPKLFNSSATIALGNYNNALAEFFTSNAFNRDERLDVGLNHFSSRGNIKGTALDNDFYNTKLNADYSKVGRDFKWGANLGAQHELYHWYGIKNGYYTEETVNSMDVKQNYFNVQAGGYLAMEDSFFKRADVLVRRFWDATNSGENSAVLKPVFEIPVSEELLTFKVKADYVGGSFKNEAVSSETNDGQIDYSFLQAGINPSLKISDDQFSLNLGLNVVYGLDMELSENNFYIYPTVTASYKLMEEMAIAYGGIEGDLKQNSFHGFVAENPYVSPTLSIQPTDQQYDAYIGLKGQLSPNFSYNIKGSYMAENRKPLFIHNAENTARNDDKSYYYGNTFQLFYDDVKTLGLFGEMHLAVNNNFTMGVNAEVYDYDTETDNPAWNLPSLTASLFMDYQIGEQWFMGANIFYVGERDDLYTVAAAGATVEEFATTAVALDGYVDVNAHLGYRINKQLSVFAKANNITNNTYMRWDNYQVQGFQVLAGATFKFDL